MNTVSKVFSIFLFIPLLTSCGGLSTAETYIFLFVIITIYILANIFVQKINIKVSKEVPINTISIYVMILTNSILIIIGITLIAFFQLFSFFLIKYVVSIIFVLMIIALFKSSINLIKAKKK